MKRFALALFALALAASTAACNTMQGMGKDIQHGGEAIQNAARK